jgi:hypothetical protein
MMKMKRMKRSMKMRMKMRDIEATLQCGVDLETLPRTITMNRVKPMSMTRNLEEQASLIERVTWK